MKAKEPTVKVEEVVVLVQVRPAFGGCHRGQVFLQVLPLVVLSGLMVVGDVQRHPAGGAGSVLFQPGAQAGADKGQRKPPKSLRRQL